MVSLLTAEVVVVSRGGCFSVVVLKRSMESLIVTNGGFMTSRTSASSLEEFFGVLVVGGAK